MRKCAESARRADAGLSAMFTQLPALDRSRSGVVDLVVDSSSFVAVFASRLRGTPRSSERGAFVRRPRICTGQRGDMDMIAPPGLAAEGSSAVSPRPSRHVPRSRRSAFMSTSAVGMRPFVCSTRATAWSSDFRKHTRIRSSVQWLLSEIAASIEQATSMCDFRYTSVPPLGPSTRHRDNSPRTA